YGWGAPTIIPLLIGMSLFDFLLGKRLSPDNTIRRSRKKQLLAFGIAANLSLLFYYKYWNFLLGEFNSLLSSLGFSGFMWSEVLLPIGISFFTFQKISYLVDVYRGTANPATTFTEYALYVALFPQLIAGPIVRYHEIAEQLHSRKVRSEDFAIGITRFSIGLGKKVLIADFVGQVADGVFALSIGEQTTFFAWLGILCYTFQIYFDFSGYSDMAIGLGRLFGFRFPENFHHPYISESIREFWTRWHITLSNWMKEYLYIPLGGNRVSSQRNALNLWIVFLLSGVWHGASWNFIVWGGYHGFFMSLERLVGAPTKRQNTIYRTIITFFLVVFSWVLFRADSLSDALTYYTYLFGLGAPATKPVMLGELLQPRSFVMLLLACVLSFYPLLQRKKEYTGLVSESPSLIFQCSAFCVLVLSLSALAGLDYTPFLYFRF
ncbi:MAG: MBOAT family protein, partial [Bdellovibrionales bacterium]|nr:MBOAT family protein [Bdellovibrionales bacterium]